MEDLKKQLEGNKIDLFNEFYKLNNPSCLLKYCMSSNHLLSGKSSSCYRVYGDDITAENYNNFHNTPSKLRDRENMNKGLWPDTNGPYPLKEGYGCEVCKNIENSGGMSDRIIANSDLNLHLLTPKEIKENYNNVVTTPTILEVFFNNTCNMGCIYCIPEFSSLIAMEHEKYNPYTKKQLLDQEKYNNLLKAHWQWMELNAKNLYEYNILGGEPFIQKELQQNIDFFIENKCPNLNVTIFTNLKIKNNKLVDLLNKFEFLLSNNHIKSLMLQCSFDCWGPQIEYIRHGLNLKQWEENFLTILKSYPTIQLNIHSTLTNLTFHTFPKLCSKIYEWIKIRPFSQTIHNVDNKHFLHPNILPLGFFIKEIEQSVFIYNEMINYIQNNSKYDKTQIDSLIQCYSLLITQLNGYCKMYDSTGTNIKLIEELKDFLNENDKRRNTNWKLLWPWLQDYN